MVLRRAINIDIEHHTRRGQRFGCSCQHCLTKAYLTKTFSYDWLLRNGYVHIEDYMPIPRPYALHDTWDTWEDVEEYRWAKSEAVRQARKKRRGEVKGRLNALRMQAYI